MRGRLEVLARRWWAGELGWVGSAMSAVTAPASWAWGAAHRMRDLRFAWAGGARVEGLVVISVGNIAVGGTGKTPFSAWAARGARDLEVPTSVVAGAQGEDEAHLHRIWNRDVPVIVDRDRLAGARRAHREGARVVVLDDGFQHRWLARDLDVVLVSTEDDFPGPLLPRGPYREAPRALERADAVVVTRRLAPEAAGRDLAAAVEAIAPGTVRGCVQLAPGPWSRLDGGESDGPAGDVLAACGVARAGVFRNVVDRLVQGSVGLVPFADHHEYGRADASMLAGLAKGRAIVTTEKDAMKLRPYRDLVGEVHVLTEELRWDWGRDDVAGLVRDAAAEADGR